MKNLRPKDLANEHGISPQAVRNYERDGFIPAAERTPTGYRIYTPVHAAALHAYLALVKAYGYATAGQVMTALHRGALDEALTLIDRGHEQLLRDRETLETVRAAVDPLTAQPQLATTGRRTVGELAYWIGVTPATLRNWETAGILVPERDAQTRYRVFDAGDIRDAELAHLLRRGGYRLDYIAAVVEQVRAAGGTEALSRALADWQATLTARSLAMLAAADRLNRYLQTR